MEVTRALTQPRVLFIGSSGSARAHGNLTRSNADMLEALAESLRQLTRTISNESQVTMPVDLTNSTCLSAMISNVSDNRPGGESIAFVRSMGTTTSNPKSRPSTAE